MVMEWSFKSINADEFMSVRPQEYSSDKLKSIGGGEFLSVRQESIKSNSVSVELFLSAVGVNVLL